MKEAILAKKDVHKAICNNCTDEDKTKCKCMKNKGRKAV